MGRADPAKINFGEGRAGVVWLDLCTTQKDSNKGNDDRLFMIAFSVDPLERTCPVHGRLLQKPAEYFNYNFFFHFEPQ